MSLWNSTSKGTSNYRCHLLQRGSLSGTFCLKLRYLYMDVGLGRGLWKFPQPLVVSKDGRPNILRERSWSNDEERLMCERS